MCDSAGITANQSEADENGWDLFIEIEVSKGSLTDPLTIHEGLTECKIQVRSTDNKKRCVDVELSNLRKMATTLLPAFYILLEYDNTDKPIRAFIKHVDQAFIYKVLKRVNELQSTDPDVKLNKNKMRVNFYEPLELTAFGIKKTIQSHINVSASEYILSKSKYLESVGLKRGII